LFINNYIFINKIDTKSLLAAGKAKKEPLLQLARGGKGGQVVRGGRGKNGKEIAMTQLIGLIKVL
jgi:hypothetical protein